MNLNRTDLMHWTSGKTPERDLASSDRWLIIVFRVELRVGSFVSALLNASAAWFSTCVRI